MNLWVGIDNGLKGGIVAIDENLKVRYMFIMPVIKGKKTEYDIEGLFEAFEELTGDTVSAVLEKAHVQPVSGKRACFMNGFGYGVMQAMLECFKIPYEIVRPVDWQREILKGINTGDTKKDSIMFCKRKWPQEDWTPTKRSVKEHDGLCDAACMALFNLRRNKNEEKKSN